MSGAVNRLVRSAIGIVLLSVLSVLGVEGGVSAWLYLKDALPLALAEAVIRPHMQPDTLVGWTSRPGARLPDEYGAGIGLAIGPQGLRGTRDAAPAHPGALRIACAGDGLTLGVGVDDAHPWCARLEVELPGVESFNLAQADYGWDQAWLRVRRDAAALGPQLVLFALTDAALERGAGARDDGRVTPHLALDGSRVRAIGVPVRSEGAGALRAARLRQVAGDLRLVQWLRTWGVLDPARTASAAVDRGWPVFDAAIRTLVAEPVAPGARLAIVFLPTRRDLAKGALDKRRDHVATLARTVGVPFIDLTPALRA
ncbi:MAG: hypothetical protein HY275_10700, partial [Gemmatimonadetes bacterium]|nr:hypothetical protein [Gemmatimonadota bacterium]